MNKQILTALTLVALASCAKDNSTTESINDQVAAIFTSASITRVANNAWEAEDKIGISMVETSTFTATESKYENVPYTVKEASASGIFTPDGTVIYFPVDGSTVDFYAYYPYLTLDETYKTISVSVADQSYKHIDLVAAKVTGKTKSDPTVTFSGDYAFAHKLSKLTMTIVAADGVGDLTDLVTTIKGQYTTAKFNIYTGGISSKSGETTDIEAVTTTTVDDSTDPATSKTISEAILIPTDAIAGSTIEFAVGGNTYTLDTKSIAFTQGTENIYTITLTRTGAAISGSTIASWGDGESDSFNASDL